jgi:F-box/leucine-rich repeat protein 10/11
MRRVSSFKQQYRQAAARAPTPPSPEYEPLSPLLQPSEPSTAHPAGNGRAPTATMYRSGQVNTAESNTPLLPESMRAAPEPACLTAAYEPSSRSAPPPPRYSAALESPIEALADVAMISQHTGPSYGELSRHASFPATSPARVSHPIGERAPAHAFPIDPTYSFDERPTKRARSELYASPQFGQAHARPATSHTPSLPYGVGQTADMSLPMHQNSGEPNDRISDAQLLLNFFAVSTQTAQSPPSTAKRWSVSQSAPAEPPPQQIRQTREPEKNPPVAPLPPPDHNSQPTHASVDLKQDPQPSLETPDVGPTAPTVQTHTPPEDISVVSPELTMSGPVAAKEPEPKPKKHQGWPKGKPRGPRTTPSTGKRKRSTPKPKSAPSANTTTSTDQLQSPLSLPAEKPPAGPVESALPLAQLPELVHDATSHIRRHSFSTPTLPLPNEGAPSTYSRAQSLPLGPQTAAPTLVAIPAQPTAAPIEPDLICAACKSSESEIKIGDGEQWIGCDGCKEWYHYPCAGFNSEREVREVNKFYCEPCRPKFGETTSRSTDALWAYSSNMVQRFVNPSEPTQLLTTLV